jgi:hypothetical protein
MARSQNDVVNVASRGAFGGNLVTQGRGYYVTLELLALVWGTSQAMDEILPDPTDRAVLLIERRSHDFIRRWMNGDPQYLSSDDLTYVKGPESDKILRSLLDSLEVPVPNRRSRGPNWGSQHVYPYVGELVHYDAVHRKNKKTPAAYEQYTYRGGGGLAHLILRSDDDQQRLDANRKGLGDLVRDSGGALGQLADACSTHDLARRDVVEETREHLNEVRDTRWVANLRDGVRNISSRQSMSRAKRIELLMHFVPYCMVRHQLDCACSVLDQASFDIPASLVDRPSPVRQLARKKHDSARGLISEALTAVLIAHCETLDPSEAEEILAKTSKPDLWHVPLGFFSASMATAGALNAHTGKRHFTLKLPLIEALVAASLEPEQEIELDEFFRELLFGRYGLVIDEHSAREVGLTNEIDSGEFSENKEQLVRDLRGLGMLREYSDATRLVTAEIS